MNSSIEGKGFFASETRNYFIYKSQSELIAASGYMPDDLSLKPLRIDIKKVKELALDSKDLRISQIKKDYLITFKAKNIAGKIDSFFIKTPSLLKWESASVFELKETSVILFDESKKQYISYFGDKKINIAVSKDLKKWKTLDTVIEPRKKYFDTGDLIVGTACVTGDGIVLFYYSKKASAYTVGAILFDINNPERMLWRADVPVWEPEAKKSVLSPIGMIYFNNKLNMYWNAKKGVMLSGCKFTHRPTFPVLEKHRENPIISPRAENPWESEYTFNAAAVEHDGKIHFVYRATGKEMVSVFGYASSEDGLNLVERLKEPIYVHVCSAQPGDVSSQWRSGYSLAGCEDPRITKIGDRLYMLYTAFDGHPKVAASSIKIDDFLNKKWKWTKPVIISPPNEVHKNWTIFPEKVKGKYAILHSINPEIAIEYCESLDFDDKTCIKSQYAFAENKKTWDTRIRGIGPPPIKTKDGWLVLYHALGKQYPGKYLLGAMLLDLKNPEKVLHKSMKPIMIPDREYENNGFKPGIVYSCGAVIKESDLIVYYGGADSVTCAAKADIDTFLEQLRLGHEISLKPLRMSVPR